MKCSNCGHENDANAEFCEKCGYNLKKSSIPEKSGMPDSTKIFNCYSNIFSGRVGVGFGYDVDEKSS